MLEITYGGMSLLEAASRCRRWTHHICHVNFPTSGSAFRLAWRAGCFEVRIRESVTYSLDQTLRRMRATHSLQRD